MFDVIPEQGLRIMIIPTTVVSDNASSEQFKTVKTQVHNLTLKQMTSTIVDPW